MAASENEASSVNRPASRVKQHKDKQGLAHKDSKTISSEEDPPLSKHHLQRKKNTENKEQIQKQEIQLRRGQNAATSFPGSFISPPQRERRKKDPGSGWSHVLVTNLSSREGFQFIKVLSPRPFVTSSEPALWATMESSFSISQRRFAISSTLLSAFETKLGLETMKK